MNIEKLIEEGKARSGNNLSELARRLGVQTTHLGRVKRGERKLPGYACVRLAMLLGIDAIKVIAASELVTEENPEYQEVWKQFIN